MPSFGPWGTASWGGLPPVTSECSHLCLDDLCRSCSSDAQCYELTGHPSCGADDGAPGRSCREVPNPNEALFHPPGAVVRAGTPLAPVAQTAGVPNSLRLALQGPFDGAMNARLAVVWWHQRAGEFDEFLQVGYDRPLMPGATEMEIAFSDVALPYEENLSCWRKCRDRPKCPCPAYGFALGSVLVALDRDQDGALSFEELRAEQIGAAAVEVGWAADAQGREGRFDSDFVGPYLIPAGFSAYAYPNATSDLAPVVLDLSVVRSHQVTPAPDAIADHVFSLALCRSGDAACTLPVTHVFCNRNCERDWGLNRFGF
jgi:hypothetical protein